MIHYLTSKHHAKAMKNFRSIGTGSVYGYEGDQMPILGRCNRKMEKNYKEYLN